MASSSKNFSPQRSQHSKCRENSGDCGRSKYTRDTKTLIKKGRGRRISSTKLSNRRRPSYISRLATTVTEQNEMSYRERSEGSIRQRQRMYDRRAQDEEMRQERMALAQMAHERQMMAYQSQMMEHEERMASLRASERRDAVLDEKEELERQDRNYYVSQNATQDAFVNGYGSQPGSFASCITGFGNAFGNGIGNPRFYGPVLNAPFATPSQLYGLGFVPPGNGRGYGNASGNGGGFNNMNGDRRDGEIREAQDGGDNEDKMDLDDEDEEEGEEN